MGNDTAVQGDYQDGVSEDAAMNAGRMAAQNGQGLAPQQPNESSTAYTARVNAYNQQKEQEGKQQ